MRDNTQLTERQKRFCLEYVGGPNAGNLTRSYMAHYKATTAEVARHNGWKMIQKPKIQAEINRIKAKVGLTEESVKQKIIEGLEALSQYRDKQTALPDFYARHKYVETAAKILDMMPNAKRQSKIFNIDIYLEKLPPEKLAQLFSTHARKINVRSKGEAKLLEEGKGESGE